MSFLNRERADFPARSASSYSLGVLFLFLLMVCGSVAHAQSAALGGVVMDPSSAMVRDAQVTVTNQRTSVALHTKTNGSGLYSVPFIQPGSYTLAVEAPGFKRYERTGITIETAQTVAIDVRLQIGETSQSVTVNGSGNYINTTDASVSTVIDRQFVENIPLNGRSFQALMTALPGVNVVTSQGAGESGEIVVNGQRTEANYFTVDGVSATTGAQSYTPGTSAGYAGAVAGETTLGTTQSMVSLDDLQEFRATTSTYSAEYGRTPGGQFTFTTRSGTNDWHGSAFEYLRNDALDANNWFNNYLGQSRQAERQNDFGGTVGGPLRIPRLYDGRNKTFFFLSYEGLRLEQAQAAEQTPVPSMSLRKEAPAALQPFLNAYPVPNTSSGTNGLSYFTSGYTAPSSLDSASIRIDHNFSDNFKIFGRYGYSPSDTTSRANSIPAGRVDLANVLEVPGHFNTLTLGSTNILSSGMSNEFRLNVTQNNSSEKYSIDNFGGAVPLAITDVPGFGSTDWLYFCTEISSFFCFRLAPQANDQRQWNATNTTTAVIQRHSLKWGIDYRRLITKAPLPIDYLSVGFYSQQAILSNTASSATDTHSAIKEMAPIYTNFSAFFQDEWKVNSRLNLSTGIRWELNPAPQDANGNNPYTVTTTNLATAVLAPKNTPLWQTTYLNFAPRFGLAYQLHQQPGHETTLRAGFGVFYDMGNALASEGYFYGAGLSSRTSFAGSPFPLTTQQLKSVSTPSTDPPYNSVFGFDPHLKLPSTMEWNLALEQALGEDQSLSFSYVASASHHLLWQKTYNPAGFGNANFINTATGGLGLTLTTNGASSNYNSLQVQFKRRLSHGLQALLGYTWSHAIDDGSTNFTVYESERASADTDIRHNFQAVLTYEIPGKYSNRLTSELLSRWSMDARVSARSAQPVDVYGATAYDVSTESETYYHPNLAPNEPLYLKSPGSPGGRLINYEAFTVAKDAAGNDIEGNFPRNGTRGFDAVQADVAIHKDFVLTDRVGLQFRTEAFNLLNHPIFGAIYNYLGYGATQFGAAYQTENTSLGGLSPLYQVGGPRSLQVALRLHF